MAIRQTHTYATLGLSKAAYDEISRKLREADYGHAFMEDGTIDMHGIGVVIDPEYQAGVAALKKSSTP